MKFKRIIFSAISILLVLCILPTLCSCSIHDIIIQEKQESLNRNKLSLIKHQIRIALPKDAIIEEYIDTHGGFLGDGEFYTKVSLGLCNKKDNFIEFVKNNWQPLPEEDIFQIIFNREADSMFLDEKIDNSFPNKIDQGYFFYRDRYFEKHGEYSSYSYNFSLALFDIDKEILYLYCIDTQNTPYINFINILSFY